MNQPQSGMNAVLWLARSEIKTFWLSFALTGGFLFLMGALVATIVSLGALGPTGDIEGANSILADLVILLLTTLLATTYLSWGSVQQWRNPSEQRLALMRTLPIPVSTLVGSRMVFMLSALVVNVPAFFVPIYLLGEIRLSFGAFIAFVVFWIGYALVWSGMTLYLDVVRGSQFVLLSSFFTGGATIGLIILVSFVLGFRIVFEIGELASNHGLVIGLAALIVGTLSFILAGWLTIRNLPRREVPV